MAVDIKNKTRKCFLIFVIFFSFFICSCGGGGGSGTAENTAPVADAGDDQTVVPGAVVSLNGSGSSDPDGDSLTYSWAFVSKPDGSGADFNDSTAVGPTFTADKAGVYEISLTVNDGKTTNSESVSITVNTPNTAPVAEAGNSKNVPFDSAITLDGSGSSDIDGDALTYVWSFLAKPSDSNTALADSTTFEPSFDADAFGMFRIQLIVNDGQVNSEPDIVEIVVGRLPDTGQTKFYDNSAGNPGSDVCPAGFEGQDASY